MCLCGTTLNSSETKYDVRTVFRPSYLTATPAIWTLESSFPSYQRRFIGSAQRYSSLLTSLLISDHVHVINFFQPINSYQIALPAPVLLPDAGNDGVFSLDLLLAKLLSIPLLPRHGPRKHGRYLSEQECPGWSERRTSRNPET